MSGRDVFPVINRPPPPVVERAEYEERIAEMERQIFYWKVYGKQAEYAMREAMREIIRIRYATDEGSIAKRADAMAAVAERYMGERA